MGLKVRKRCYRLNAIAHHLSRLGSVARLSALLIEIIHFVHRNPLRVSNLIPEAQLTFYQQPQKVSKKGRAPAKF